MAEKLVICIKKIDTTILLVTNDNNVKIYNISPISGCNSTLISSGRLRKTRIIFQKNHAAMKLMKQKKVITQAKKTLNLFILDLAHSKKAMFTITFKFKSIATLKPSLQISMVSQNKRISLRY